MRWLLVVVVAAGVAVAVVSLFPSNVVLAEGGWERIGPEGGFVWVLGISPGFENDRTVFVGTDGGGVFRSTDGGETWQKQDRGLTTRTVPTLVVSPAYERDATVFAGSSVGVFRSVDRGDTWRLVNEGLENPKVLVLAISPAFETDATFLFLDDVNIRHQKVRRSRRRRAKPVKDERLLTVRMNLYGFARREGS